MKIAYCRRSEDRWPIEGSSPEGWEVACFPDCETLEEALRDSSFDAVVAELPAESGRLTEMLSRVRVASAGMPVIVAADPVGENAAAQSLSSGAADYWLTSMSAQRLRVAIEQAVSRRRSGTLQKARDEALERVEDAVVVTDAAERIVYWNRAATRLYGYAYAEVLGRLLPDTLSPLWLDAETRAAAWHAVAARGVWLGETTHARRDGSPVLVSLEITASRDQTGRRSGLLFVARPATQWCPLPASPEARRDPRDTREFLERIINAVADPIFVKDGQHRMLLVNDALCALLKVSREHVLGKGDTEFLPPAQAEIFYRQDDLVLKTGHENVNEELVTDSEGKVHVLITKKTLWHDSDGRPYLVGIIRDVTEMMKAVDDLKRSQEQLRHAQKLEAVGRLAGGVAHDFNNVLTAMVGCAGMLMETLPPGHVGREDAEDIQRAGEQAATLTRQLLAFSRREEGLSRAVDLRVVFGGMRRMLQRLLPADIELDFSVPDRLGSVRLDPGQAEQVLLNLVVNAGDAMPSGGRITVTLGDAPEGGAGLTGPSVLLCVADTGVGMDAATQDKIFEPYFSTKAGGTGLGLATVRDVVAQSGGVVTVESSQGRGSTFRVFWPAVQSPAENEPGASAAPIRRPLRAANILLIEDDDAVRRFAVRCLEKEGYSVLAAADGIEGLRISDSREGLFDVVVIDVVLPRLRGTEVAERLRARQPTARILFMSGYRGEESGAHEAGIRRAPFLQKPFNATQLVDQIRDLLLPVA
jgi:PAS domain S-box-containing protein